MKKILFALLMALAFSALAVEIPAPLGMKWGDTTQTVTSQYGGDKVKTDRGVDLYVIRKPPISIYNIDYVIGLVHPTRGLIKVILAKTIVNDAYGSEGVNLYGDYKKKLTEKYGKPDSYEYIGKKVYTDPDDFYQCLNYEGCGSFSSFFGESRSGTIAVELEGKSRGSGDIKLSYESPEFSKYVEEMKQEQDKKTALGL